MRGPFFSIRPPRACVIRNSVRSLVRLARAAADTTSPWNAAVAVAAFAVYFTPAHQTRCVSTAHRMLEEVVLVVQAEQQYTWRRFTCRLRMASNWAGGGMATMPQQQRAEPSGTKGDADLLPKVPFHISLWCRSRVLLSSGPSKSDPLTCALVAHLLQQAVDEQVLEHVEETASSHSIDV